MERVVVMYCRVVRWGYVGVRTGWAGGGWQGRSVSGGFQQSSGADKAGSDACTGRPAAAEGERVLGAQSRLITGQRLHHHQRWQRRHCIGVLRA